MESTMQSSTTTSPAAAGSTQRAAAPPVSRGVFRGWSVVMKRELGAYFTTPVAYVFLTIYLLLSNGFPWFFGQLYESDQASMRAFLGMQPLLFLALVPALAMRLWAEERHSGTIETLLTLPITSAGAVLGKFLAAWIFIGIALGLTATNWASIAYLGDPDHGTALAGYIGTFLLAGVYLSISAAISSMTKNQVIALVLSLSACLALYLVSFLGAQGNLQQIATKFAWLSPVVWVAEKLSELGVIEHQGRMIAGRIDLRDIVYFASMISFGLFLNVFVVEHKKAR